MFLITTSSEEQAKNLKIDKTDDFDTWTSEFRYAPGTKNVPYGLKYIYPKVQVFIN